MIPEEQKKELWKDGMVRHLRGILRDRIVNEQANWKRLKAAKDIQVLESHSTRTNFKSNVSDVDTSALKDASSSSSMQVAVAPVPHRPSSPPGRTYNMKATMQLR